jgi:hypothetical protein
MLKELIKIANDLDSRGLVKEADRVDLIISMASFLREVPPQRELEEYRERQIKFYKEEGSLNLGQYEEEFDPYSPSSGNIEDAMRMLEFYSNATHEELLKDMIEQEEMANAFRALSDFSSTLPPQEREEDYFEVILESHVRNFLNEFGAERVQKALVSTYGRSQFDEPYELPGGNVIEVPSILESATLLEHLERHSTDHFYETLKKFDLDAVMAIMLAIKDDLELYSYEDVIESSIKNSSPILVQHVLSKLRDSETISFIEEHLSNKLNSTHEETLFLMIGDSPETFGLNSEPSVDGGIDLSLYPLEAFSGDLDEEERPWQQWTFEAVIREMGATGKVLVDNNAVEEYKEDRQPWLKFDNEKISELIKGGTLKLAEKEVSGSQAKEYEEEGMGDVKLYSLTS